MKERYLYYRLNGELSDRKVQMWQLIDNICNVRNSIDELERLQTKLADIQADIEHFKRLNARILRLNT